MRRTTVLAAGLCAALLTSGIAGASPAVATAASAASAAPAAPAEVPAPDLPVDEGRASAATAEGIPVQTPAPDPSQAGRSAPAAASADFTEAVIPKRADIVVHKVTIALVAPQGTTPSFTADEAKRSLGLVDQFYNRETGGAIRFELERVIDWQSVDEPIACSDTGALHAWLQRKTGWQSGPARHIVAMAPEGAPCPDWANGEQPGDPDDGGRSFQPGPDAYTLAHELGHNLSLNHASSVHCATSWDPTPGATCAREEYGNRTDVMGGSWSLLPLSAPSLARLGTLAATRQPVCGAPRTAVLDTLGAGPGAARALTWTDPKDPSARYWVQYSDRADQTSDVGAYQSPFQVKRAVSGVQVLRSNPTAPFGGDLLQRPGDDSENNEFALPGETVGLNSGMLVKVVSIDAAARKATVTVTVPCNDYVGEIAGFATPTASYTSPWTSVGAVIDGDTASLWGSWPRTGEQSIELRWPEAVTVDRATVTFASDAADTDRRGLIPPRSWRVERWDDASGSFKPVDGATPAAGPRVRDAGNAVSFTAVTTTALRLVFTAWGDAEYTGSPGVTDIDINGVGKILSLSPRGSAGSIPTATTATLALGVDVRGAGQAGLPGRAVTFALTGPATFAGGARTAMVVSDARGVAALPPVTTGQATGTLAVTASAPGVATVSLAATTVKASASASVTVSVVPRLVSGKAVLSITTRNSGPQAADLTVVTSYGTYRLQAVTAGASVTRTVATNRASIPAGSVTVTALSNGARAGATATYRAR